MYMYYDYVIGVRSEQIYTIKNIQVVNFLVRNDSIMYEYILVNSHIDIYTCK